MPSTKTRGFGWWEIEHNRDLLRLKVTQARWWLSNADATTPEKYAHGLMNARTLLDEAVEMLEVEGESVRP